MKAGGGKAAFRQSFLFSYESQHAEKYDAIALGKFPYISKWLVYSLKELNLFSELSSCTLFLRNVSLWEILNGEYKNDFCSGKATLCLQNAPTGDNISIDNGILRLDVYRHRFFELGLVKRHWRYICKWSIHKKTGEYPRMYVEIPLTELLAEVEVAERVCRVLLKKNPGMREWVISAPSIQQPVRVHIKSVHGQSRAISHTDDQGIYDFVNSYSLSNSPHLSEEIYLYEIEGAFLNRQSFENENVVMIEGKSRANAVVSFTDQQHPLIPSILHEPARIFFIRRQAVQEDRCITLCYA